VVQESNAEKAIEVCLSLVHLDTRATWFLNVCLMVW
jgi:hypothetical protein